MTPTRKQRYEMLRSQLSNERSSFISHWRDLNDYILPRRGRFVTSDVNRGDRRTKNIIDSTATFAARTCSSGMMAGVTSPARPWKRLTTPDPELSESGAVKEWLHTVDQRMDTVFLKSNLYNALPTLYGDMAVFGTGAMAVLEDDDDVIRCVPFPIGSYMLGNDDKLRVRVFVREFQMTVRQIVERFGRIGASGQPDWSNISTSVRSQWERGQMEGWVDVCHVITPNRGHDPERITARDKPFSSCYYEKGQPEDKYLEESGFDEFPILAPRWEVTGEDVYGTNCPGMTALGDIKQLQLGEKRAAQGLDKLVNPPMVAPMELFNRATNTLPGGVTYQAMRDGQQGFRPAYQIDPRLDLLEQKQQTVRLRIQRAFYEDLFLMLAQSDRREITAREIDERHEEKLLALGPVLEQLNQDLLDPLVDRTFAIMMRRGMIPPPPEELEGMPLRVDYISVMAQAQKMVGIAGLERFASFGLQFAAVDPSILDKIDRDQLIDEYGDMTGVPPRVIVPDEKVAEIRQSRAQAAQAQQAAEQAAQLAPAAKQLSETNTEQPSALSALLGGAV